MATLESVREGVATAVAWLDEVDPDTRRKIPDRSISAWISDLDVAFAGRFESGTLVEVREIDPATRAEHHLRLVMDSDTFVEVVYGDTSFAHGWARGRIHVDARLRDLFELRRFL